MTENSLMLIMQEFDIDIAKRVTKEALKRYEHLVEGSMDQNDLFCKIFMQGIMELDILMHAQKASNKDGRDSEEVTKLAFTYIRAQDDFFRTMFKKHMG